MNSAGLRALFEGCKHCLTDTSDVLGRCVLNVDGFIKTGWPKLVAHSLNSFYQKADFIDAADDSSLVPRMRHLPLNRYASSIKCMSSSYRLATAWYDARHTWYFYISTAARDSAIKYRFDRSVSSSARSITINIINISIKTPRHDR